MRKLIAVLAIAFVGCTGSVEPTSPSVPQPIFDVVTAAASIHVGDLDAGMTFIERDGRYARYSGFARAFVHDENHNVVQGAVIFFSPGLFCGPTLPSGGCGYFVTSRLNKKQETYTVSIFNLVLAGAVYDPSANHDPDGDSNGTVIVVPLVQ
jgi:hypothetical protein